MQPQLLSSSIWEYKNEGNLNIVLSYVGNDSRYVNSILRLRKIDKPLHEEENLQASEEEIYTAMTYSNEVFAPILGSDYLIKPTLLKLTREFLIDLVKTIHPYRPPHRHTKEINLSQKYGFMELDGTRLPFEGHTFGVEIKPKWGFLPSSPHVMPMKRRVCRYCMHQNLKRKLNPSFPLSRFCPLDLFSGDEGRIHTALIALMECPQNNINIFLNGKKIDIKDQVNHTQCTDDISSNLITILTAILLKEPLLQKLKFHQRALDRYDIENIYKLFNKLQYSQEPTLEEWRHTIKSYICTDSQRDKDPLQVIREFLISATLKDCSILIALQKSSEKKLETQGYFRHLSISPSENYIYSIKVIDLDPKSIFKIPHYYELDKKIVTNFPENQEKICIESNG